MFESSFSTGPLESHLWQTGYTTESGVGPQLWLIANSEPTELAAVIKASRDYASDPAVEDRAREIHEQNDERDNVNEMAVQHFAKLEESSLTDAEAAAHWDSLSRQAHDDQGEVSADDLNQLFGSENNVDETFDRLSEVNAEINTKEADSQARLRSASLELRLSNTTEDLRKLLVDQAVSRNRAVGAASLTTLGWAGMFAWQHIDYVNDQAQITTELGYMPPAEAPWGSEPTTVGAIAAVGLGLGALWAIGRNRLKGLAQRKALRMLSETPGGEVSHE